MNPALPDGVQEEQKKTRCLQKSITQLHFIYRGILTSLGPRLVLFATVMSRLLTTLASLTTISWYYYCDQAMSRIFHWRWLWNRFFFEAILQKSFFKFPTCFGSHFSKICLCQAAAIEFAIKRFSAPHKARRAIYEETVLDKNSNISPPVTVVRNFWLFLGRKILLVYW